MAKVPKTAGDPQVDNCPKQHGGKRGLPVADNVFELDVDLAHISYPSTTKTTGFVSIGKLMSSVG